MESGCWYVNLCRMCFAKFTDVSEAVQYSSHAYCCCKAATRKGINRLEVCQRHARSIIGAVARRQRAHGRIQRFRQQQGAGMLARRGTARAAGRCVPLPTNRSAQAHSSTSGQVLGLHHLAGHHRQPMAMFSSCRTLPGNPKLLSCCSAAASEIRLDAQLFGTLLQKMPRQHEHIFAALTQAGRRWRIT
jgi:hypothetical protein